MSDVRIEPLTQEKAERLIGALGEAVGHLPIITAARVSPAIIDFRDDLQQALNAAKDRELRKVVD